MHIYLDTHLCVNRSCSFVPLYISMYNTRRIPRRQVPTHSTQKRLQLIQLPKQEKVSTHSLYLVKVSSSKNHNH